MSDIDLTNLTDRERALLRAGYARALKESHYPGDWNAHARSAFPSPTPTPEPPSVVLSNGSEWRRTAVGKYENRYPGDPWVPLVYTDADIALLESLQPRAPLTDEVVEKAVAAFFGSAHGSLGPDYIAGVRAALAAIWADLAPPAPGAVEQERDALRAEVDTLAARLRAICQKAVAIVGAERPTNAEDAVDRLCAEVERLKARQAGLGDHIQHLSAKADAAALKVERLMAKLAPKWRGMVSPGGALRIVPNDDVPFVPAGHRLIGLAEVEL